MPTDRYPRTHPIIATVLLLGLPLLAPSCGDSPATAPSPNATGEAATSQAPREPQAPPELQNGTASLTQAKTWARVVFDSDHLGSAHDLVTENRDLTPGGKPAIFVSDPFNGGTGGNTYLIFEQTAKGLRYLGEVAYGACRAVVPDAAGRPRLITYWHLSASEGELRLWSLTDTGFKEIKSVPTNYSDLDERERFFDTLFGSKQVPESVLESTFGLTATSRPK